jgi:hypothetical protein
MNYNTVLSVALSVLVFGLVVALLIYLFRLASGRVFQQRLQAMRLEASVRVVEAVTRPPVMPYHYAPHVHISNGSGGSGTLPTLPLSNQLQAMPSFSDMLLSGRVGSGNPLVLGFDQAGVAIESDWRGLYSTGVGGLQGSGKTTTAAFLLSQSVLSGARLLVVDPHAGDDQSLANILNPIRGAYLADVAEGPESVLAAIAIANEEIHRRESGAADRWALVVIVDEWTSLLLRDDLRLELPRSLSHIATSGRKFNVHCMLIAHRWASQDVGGGLLRNVLTSAYVHRLRRDEARMLTGMGTSTPKDTLELQPGEAYLVDTRGKLDRVRVPQVLSSDMATVERLLADKLVDRSTVCMPVGSQLVATDVMADSSLQSAETARIYKMFLDGVDPSGIVFEVFGVRSNQGRKYQNALTDVLSHIRAAAGGVQK